MQFPCLLEAENATVSSIRTGWSK